MQSALSQQINRLEGAFAAFTAREQKIGRRSRAGGKKHIVGGRPLSGNCIFGSEVLADPRVVGRIEAHGATVKHGTPALSRLLAFVEYKFSRRSKVFLELDTTRWKGNYLGAGNKSTSNGVSVGMPYLRTFADEIRRNGELDRVSKRAGLRRTVPPGQ